MDSELQPQIHPTNDYGLPQTQALTSHGTTTPDDITSSMWSSSSIVTGTQTSSDSSPIHTTTTFIDVGHYSMLVKNNIEGLYDEFSPEFLVLESDGSNILHIAAGIGLTNVINTIIQRSSQLIYHPNNKGDLPIHVAARSCQFEGAKLLVKHVADDNEDAISKLLDTQNNDGNTALHIAIENQHEELATLLFDICPITFCRLNKQGFSPLYLAIKAKFSDLVKFMLYHEHFDNMSTEAEETFKLDAAKSVVHAVILANEKDIFKMMCKKFTDIVLYKTGEMGTTPLAYAAYIGFLDGVECILNDPAYQNQAYKIDENGYYPIHWACRGGDIKVVKEFFTRLPINTRLMLNNKGQNILHVAAAYGKAEVVKHILKQPQFGMMINMKDEDGNIPLHLASINKYPKVVYEFTWDDRVNLSAQNKHGCTALDIAEDFGDQIPSFEERLTWLSLRNAGVPRAPKLHNINIHVLGQDVDIINSLNAQTAHMMVLDQLGNPLKNHPLTRKRKHKYKERINTLLLVATLVATVTFASGFTVPGGYNNDNPHIGTATLARKWAFQVFVISNTIAMYTSILTMVTLIWAQLDDLRLVLLSLDFAVPLLGVSLAMMSVAFMAGLYVVLYNVVFWLGLLVLVMGGMSLVAILVFFIPLYSPRSSIRSKFLRKVFHFPFTLLLLACDEKGKREKQQH